MIDGNFPLLREAPWQERALLRINQEKSTGNEQSHLPVFL